MDNHRILITGDFWHRDFRDVLNQLKVPTTLVPRENLRTYADSGDDFELIVLAQGSREEFSREEIEFLQRRFPQTPIISLLGSWCEGQLRSGRPVLGTIRIYWHQWQGRFDSFAEEVNTSQISTWHLPRTAIPVDRVIKLSATRAKERRAIERAENDVVVGVSAWTQDGFEMISDALGNLGFRCNWLENDALDGIENRRPAVICINADSLSANLRENVLEQRSRFSDVPIVVLLNFPRKFEVDAARQMGVCEIVSKPYELIDLKFALERALRGQANVEMHQNVLSRHIAR